MPVALYGIRVCNSNNLFPSLESCLRGVLYCRCNTKYCTRNNRAKMDNLPKLSEEEMDLCRKAFHMFDKDGART